MDSPAVRSWPRRGRFRVLNTETGEATSRSRNHATNASSIGLLADNHDDAAKQSKPNSNRHRGGSGGTSTCGGARAERRVDAIVDILHEHDPSVRERGAYRIASSLRRRSALTPQGVDERGAFRSWRARLFGIVEMRDETRVMRSDVARGRTNRVRRRMLREVGANVCKWATTLRRATRRTLESSRRRVEWNLVWVAPSRHQHPPRAGACF